MLERLLRITDRLIAFSVSAGAFSLLIALGVTSADVVSRLFGHPIYGARDIVSMAGVFVVFGGIAHAYRSGSHIAVDVLERSFSPSFNRLFSLLAHVLSAAVMALVAWQLWVAVDLARMLNMSTNLLYLPRAPFLMAMSVMAVIACLVMTLKAMAAITQSDQE